MMNRRLFFRAFAGAPVVAGAAIAQSQAQPLAVQSASVCICGGSMYLHGPYGGASYLTCTMPQCPQYAVPVMAPRIAVQAAPAELVARVKAKEAEEEREKVKLARQWQEAFEEENRLNHKVGETIYLKPPLRRVE